MLAGTEDERRRITRYITAGHVDGVLLVSSHSGDPVAEQLREAGVPLVMCGKPHRRRLQGQLRGRGRPGRRP